MFEEATQPKAPSPDRLRAMVKQCRYVQGEGGCPCQADSLCHLACWIPYDLWRTMSKLPERFGSREVANAAADVFVTRHGLLKRLAE